MVEKDGLEKLYKDRMCLSSMSQHRRNLVKGVLLKIFGSNMLIV